MALELRRVLDSDAILPLATAQERFALADGDVVVEPELGGLEVLPEDPRNELSGLVAASLDELDRDPGAAARLEQLLDTQSPSARGTVELALAWQASRQGDRERAARLLADLDAHWNDGGHPLRATAAGLALLHASANTPIDAALLATIARGQDAEVRAVVERLRELGARESAVALEALQREIASRRHILATARTLLGVLTPASTPLVLSVGDALLIYRPRARGEGNGALLDPQSLVQRIRAAPGLLVVPWDGVAPTTPATRGAIDVVPGALALAPAPRPADHTGPLGLLLVFAACAATFLGALFAVRRGLLRERDAMRVRSEFLTTVTHELRTPIAAIRLLAERLCAGAVQSDARRGEYHALLASEATRLSTLVENVLDLGRMERGERAYDMRPLRVGELLDETARVFATIARAEDLPFELHDAAPDARIVADRAALQQALLNLCDNARKYGRGDGPIELRAEIVDHRVQLCVRDHGPGVPPAERARIFERFVRGEAQRSGAVPGVGLGLHLAQAIAVAHGGTLEHRVPDDGVGAAFVLTVPTTSDEDRES